jgi:hypothetical protein
MPRARSVSTKGTSRLNRINGRAVRVDELLGFFVIARDYGIVFDKTTVALGPIFAVSAGYLNAEADSAKNHRQA